MAIWKDNFESRHMPLTTMSRREQISEMSNEHQQQDPSRATSKCKLIGTDFRNAKWTPTTGSRATARCKCNLAFWQFRIILVSIYMFLTIQSWLEQVIQWICYLRGVPYEVHYLQKNLFCKSCCDLYIHFCKIVFTDGKA